MRRPPATWSKSRLSPASTPPRSRRMTLTRDPMEAVSQILQRDEGLSSEELSTSLRKGFRFDLCPCCHDKFLKDPLGKEFLRSFDFSKN